jgi:hypothetical protein
MTPPRVSTMARQRRHAAHFRQIRPLLEQFQEKWNPVFRPELRQKQGVGSVHRFHETMN